MHIIVIALLVALGVLAPEMAWAANINPSNGNTWDMYVFGNGRVIFDVLNSIKMLMVPDAGSSGFRTLLLFMATLGFLVLAVGAGFDPAKNFIKMFMYVLVVGAVSAGSTQLTANVNVNDMVVNRDGLRENFVVDRVPALVVLPAALTSQVGRYFTRTIETYFSMPGEFKIAGDNAGQFNLFGKMISDSNEFIFTDAGAKQSLAAYVTDCVVPAIARGKFQGDGLDPTTGKMGTLTGANALAGSANMMATFQSAKHPSIMTKVFPSPYIDLSSVVDTDDSGAPVTPPAQGVVTSCTKAYDLLQTMIDKNANALMEASSEAYKSAGVMTPFATLFSSLLARASAPGSSGAAYSSPSGFMMQQGMLNSMSGSFRQAAIQTGNNELMTAAAITQAEQNQRSAWVAGFHVFNNMMAYVFTVLQVFIFAITPMVVVALMIPGLGRSIFVNYSQILIWLTLWMPMLALINYIITLFGTESMSLVLTQGGGLSLNNKALMTERTNNLVIAAQFLGTMTPLLTWGLVRGAMAFTEFISHGIGSAFATQAGAVAATGNFSSNNLSMDNASMNKYNTAMASTVGTQATNAFTNAGTLLASADVGGGNVVKSGAQVNAQKAASEALSAGISQSEQISSTISAAKSQSASLEEAYARSLNSGQGAVSEKAASQILQSAKQASMGEGAGKNMTAEERKSLQDSVSAMEQVRSEYNSSVKGGVGVNVGVAKIGTDVGASVSSGGANAKDDNASVAKAAGSQVSADSKASRGISASETGSVADTHRSMSSTSRDTSASSRMSASQQAVMSDALNKQESVTRSLSATKGVVESFGVNSDMDVATVNQRIAAMNSMQEGMANDVAGIEARGAALGDSLTGRQGETKKLIDQYAAQSRAGQQGGGGLGGVPSGYATIKDEAKLVMGQASAAVDAGAAATKQQNHTTGAAAQDRIDNTNPKGLTDTNFRKPGAAKGDPSLQNVLSEPFKKK